MNYPPPITKEPNWWGRNWKWAVPVLVVGAFTMMMAFFALIFFGIFGLLKSSDAYRLAVEKAKAHPAVVEALGSPIKEGLLVTGNINLNGSSGEADLAVPLSGPKGKGTLYLVATKSAGQWTYSRLELAVSASRTRIDLLAPVADP